MQEVFPREEGQGWALPKTHGLTKMQTYMCLFGSGINFYGGPGECNHKKFVKDTGNNTQLQIGTFTSQVAERMYETMLFELAKTTMHRRENRKYELIGGRVREDEMSLEGKYYLTVDGITHEGIHTGYSLRWANNNTTKMECNVPYRFVSTLTKHAFDLGEDGSFSVTGYTCCKMSHHGRDEIYRSAQHYRGNDCWYDWAMVQYEQGGSLVCYPARILGFFRFRNSNTVHAVVQSTVQPLSMEQLEQDFVSKITIGSHPTDDYCVIEAKSIHHPLYVFPNIGGLKDEYFCALPKRRWAQYFGRKISQYVWPQE